MRRLTLVALALLLMLGSVSSVAPPILAAPADEAVLDGAMPLNAQALAELSYERARSGARWLAQNLRTNGKFQYIYDPDADRYENAKYNPVRHAGVTYSLFQATEAFGYDSLRVAAEKATRFMIDSSPFVEEGRRAFIFANRT